MYGGLDHTREMPPSLCVAGDSQGCAAVVCVPLCCSNIAEAEAAVSVNEKRWLVMHMRVQLKLDELRGPPNPWLTVT
jgi:hypothetical protein